MFYEKKKKKLRERFPSRIVLYFEHDEFKWWRQKIEIIQIYLKSFVITNYVIRMYSWNKTKWRNGKVYYCNRIQINNYSFVSARQAVLYFFAFILLFFFLLGDEVRKWTDGVGILSKLWILDHRGRNSWII